MTLEDMEIKDAKEDLPFKPIRDDVEKAIRQENACCVAANALMRFASIQKVRIGLSVSYVKFTKNGFWSRYKTPKQLYVEIIALDRGGEFILGEYYLAKMPDSETSRRGKAHTKRPSKHPRPYETKRRPHYILVGTRARVDVGHKKEKKGSILTQQENTHD